jgi:pyoverdine/dityrosine biosynthesis protein Dit1
MDMPPPPTVEIHEHPSEGPHHGSLIELGKEEFHAELVHDDKSVTIYVLDSAAKNFVPADASEVVINVLHDGKPEQLKLAAAPQRE